MNKNLEEDIKIKECVGCGFCCLKARCIASLRLHHSAKECPELRWDEEKNRYFCKLAEIKGPLGDNYKKELYIGAGCCMSLNTWRTDVKRRDRKEANPSTYNPISREFQIFLKSLASEPFLSGDTISLILYYFKEELKKFYNGDEIKQIVTLVNHYIQEGRSTIFKSFMG